jgi:hypothetical protein
VPSVAQTTTLKTGHYTIDPASVTAGRGDILYTKNAGLLYNLNTGSWCFSAGVNLPHRATVTRITAWYKGGTGPAPLIMRLLRSKLADGTNVEVGYGVLSNKNVPRKAETLGLTASHAVVDNVQHSYGIDLCIPPDGSRFYGARITYTYIP